MLLTIPTLALSALFAAQPSSPDAEIETLRAALPALAAPASIDLDSVEIPTIRAATLEDAVCAQGWMHARERFLQMDLARREPAGELGQLIPKAIDLDRQTVRFDLRAIAERAVARLPERHRALLAAYAAGVNAQLSVAKPFEYQMLKATCAPWTPADSMLVQLSMARYLDSSDEADRARTPLYKAFGAEVAAFLTSSRGALDMSVDGSPLGNPSTIPSAVQLDLRSAPETQAKPADARTPEQKSPEQKSPEQKSLAQPGSNAFAVAGSRTRDGRAIVGNDMHLALMAPNFWYRVDLEWNGGRLIGLSLPGVPAIVQGTNGRVAWGFTNLTADLSDLVLVERDPANPDNERTADGAKPLVRRSVTIGAGKTQEAAPIVWTSFGPAIATLPDGRLLAVRSPILVDEAIDFGLFDMVDATTVEEALRCARAWKGPPQNVLVAGADGRIGWTISGSLPLRDHATPRTLDWREAGPWRGTMPAEAKPMIVDPPSGILTSANQLSVAPSGALAGVLGSDETAGDRAYRLRELLAARTDWDEPALYGVQLDIHSHRLVRWRDAILAALGDATLSEMATKARAELAAWDGEVTAVSCAPVLLDGCRREMAVDFGAWLARTESGTRSGLTASEATAALDDEALLRILETRPAHLVAPPAGVDTRPDANPWQRAAVAWLSRAEGGARAPRRDAAKGDAANSEPSKPFVTRGDRNRLAMRHPAADMLGPAARLAEMPKVALPGHPTCVRVQTPGFGASERSVISPAKLEAAILVTPGGQSGLPTSPHFRSLHAWWQDGKPYPLLPDQPKKRIALDDNAPKSAPPEQPADAVSPSN